MALTKKDAKNLSPPERTSVALSQLRSQVNAKGAHFFRTSYRRLQTWLRTFDDFSPDKRQKRGMKYLDKILRACGKLRDTELHRKMLRSIEVNGDPTACAAIERTLRKRRDKRRDAVTALLQERTKLEDASPVLESLKELTNHRRPPQSAHEQNYLEAALQNYARYQHDHPAVTEENLHEYRLACKEFRYHAELAGDSARAVVTLFKNVQDAIGEWHDWQLLLELSRKELAKRPSKLLTKIEEITAAKLAEAFRAVEEIEPQLLSAASEPRRKPVSSARSGGRQQKVA